MSVQQHLQLHVLPVGDLIEHEDYGTGCVCIPTVEYSIATDGDARTLVVHHSLDGRELQET